jgi:hypothetical protein
MSVTQEIEKVKEIQENHPLPDHLQSEAALDDAIQEEVVEGVQDNETVEIQEVELDDSEIVIPSVLRTRRDGVWEIYNGTWGSYLRPTDDPDANIVINDDNLKAFDLNPDIHRIPAELWTAWVKLCFYYVSKVPSSVEVSIRFLRSAEDSSKYRILVPRQKVSGATVRVDSFDEAIDIVTGEEITQYPPEGWIPVGSSHSHNTMPAFYSGTDDKYELGDPGIHLVVGGINVEKMKYTIAASVVGSGRRFIVDYDKLIDATPIPEVDFHPKVIDYVDYTTPLITTNYSNTSKYPTKWSKKTSDYDTSSYQDWCRAVYGDGSFDDPYHYQDSAYGSSGTFTSTSTSKTPALWEIEDVINDYLIDNQDNMLKLCTFADSLRNLLSDIEATITLNAEISP